MTETVEEQALRLCNTLKEECQPGDKDPEEWRGFMLLMFEPKIDGEAAYSSNMKRPMMLKFLEEFLERNKPARGRGNG